ncbi:MAG: trypsin-like peptidase domain-containing protein [Thermoanaerobaculia bacterium]
MSFLDDVPQDWTRPELPELRDLLVLAYRRPTAAEDLADEVGLVAGTFPNLPNMRATWTALVKVLGDQKRLRPLVQKAADDPAAGAYRERFLNFLEDHPIVAAQQPVAPAANWWKGGDLVNVFPERLMERRTRLMQIALAAWVTQASHSVARLILRFGAQSAHGTGFLIDEDLLLTNHHNVVHPDYGNVTSVVAEFDHEEGFVGKPLVGKGKIASIVGDARHDWAVIPLETAVDRTPLKLGTPYDVGIDDAVVIIQHPKGAYKQFSLEPLAIRHVDPERIQYVADTQQGSSGSPVFNSLMHVIALHHAEAEVAVNVKGKQETVWRNEGVHIAQVMKALTERKLKFTAQE